MRVALFSPLPPERSGIADYSYELLEELRYVLNVTAVVRDDLVDQVEAPLGVPIVGASSVPIGAFDTNIYQMGNNSKYHRFIFDRALDEPGLLVMHDPSLADYHAEICGGGESVVFREEIAFDRPDLDAFGRLPTIDVGDGRLDLDRLEVLMARRIVESNRRTLLNSTAMAKVFAQRYPGSEIGAIHLPGRVVERTSRALDLSRVVFGVFGGINYYKRVQSAVAAFVTVHAEFPNTEMVVAGRADDRKLEAEIRQIATRSDLVGALRVETSLTLEELEAEMAACDVAIQLRWPTAGEMSATLLRSFGAGKPAIVTDVPQFAEIDDAFCWRVPIDESLEVDALVAKMRAVAADPVGAQLAGVAAQAFVAREANYAAVAREYARHAEESLTSTPARSSMRLPGSTALGGVNLVVCPGLSPQAESAINALHQMAEDAQLVTYRVALELDSTRTAPKFASPILRKALPADGRSATSAKSSAAHLHGAYGVNIVLIDPDYAVALTGWVREEQRLGRPVIGYFAPTSVPPTRDVLTLLYALDEVWTPTRFSQELLSGYCDGRVECVPLDVPVVAMAAPSRKTRFLVLVDGTSSSTLAHPARSIRAYGTAFADDLGRAALVVGVRGVNAEEREAIAREVSLVDGAIAEFATEVDELALIGGCDVLLSLHRVETFAHAIAIALASGRRVVATDGFGTPDAPPAARLRTVRTRGIRLQPSTFIREPEAFRGSEDEQIWGDADLQDAARIIRECADRRNETVVGLGPVLGEDGVHRTEWIAQRVVALSINARVAS